LSGFFQRLALRSAGLALPGDPPRLRLRPRSRFEPAAPAALPSEESGEAHASPAVTTRTAAGPLRRHATPNAAADPGPPPRSRNDGEDVAAPSVEAAGRVADGEARSRRPGTASEEAGIASNGEAARKGDAVIEQVGAAPHSPFARPKEPRPDAAVAVDIVEARAAHPQVPLIDRDGERTDAPPEAGKDRASEDRRSTDAPGPALLERALAPRADSDAANASFSAADLPDPFRQGPEQRAVPPMSLSIGRIDIEFLPPPASPAPAVQAKERTRGFAHYARIRRGSPR
jgi:hypothetical protein